MSAAVTAAVVIGVVVIGAFAGRPRHDGADKAAWAVVFFASAVVVGTILALIQQAGRL
ncbi:hypothetical protein [Streptomonospora sp. PA3]|uniref:hypothetical protein n=1 Tax=Streptomonospora sp. PA3 TaxID=2607326 RepID=UPI0012DEAC6C|nr:hypothetical protein [Streptomonospora sp. PA3]